MDVGREKYQIREVSALRYVATISNAQLEYSRQFEKTKKTILAIELEDDMEKRRMNLIPSRPAHRRATIVYYHEHLRLPR
jgi:hypothetical protein